MPFLKDFVYSIAVAFHRPVKEKKIRYLQKVVKRDLFKRDLLQRKYCTRGRSSGSTASTTKMSGYLLPRSRVGFSGWEIVKQKYQV